MPKKLIKISVYVVLFSVLTLLGSFSFGNYVYAQSGFMIHTAEMSMDDLSDCGEGNELISSYSVSNATSRATIMPCCIESSNLPSGDYSNENGYKIGYKDESVSVVVDSTDNLAESNYTASSIFSSKKSPPPEVALASIRKKE